MNSTGSGERTLPEIYIQLKHQNDNGLQIALCDSGSQGNIISLQQYLDLGFKEENIQRCEEYNIRSSSELVKNCIRGKVNLDMFCLMQKVNDYSEFGKTRVQFLVANNNINLGRLILGVPYLDKNKVKLHFGNGNCSIKCILRTEQGIQKVNLQTRSKNKIQISNMNYISENDQIADFELNRILLEDNLFSVLPFKNL